MYAPKNKRQVSKIDRQLLLELHSQGKDNEFIAKLFGVTRQRVQQVSKSLGIDSIRKQRKDERLAGINIAELTDLYSVFGWNKKKLANRFGVQIPIIDEIVSELNLKRSTVFTSIPPETLNELYIVQGKTAKQISEIYNLSRRAVENIIIKSGLRKHIDIAITPELIQDLYINKDMSQQAVAEHLGIATVTITKYCKTFGIKKSVVTRAKRTVTLSLDINEIKELYIDKQLPASKISKMLNINEHTLRSFIYKSGLNKRKQPTNQ
jgi:predicted transcriptional regulator